MVAALIWRGDRFLICRRPENKARALLWEFPGGKVDPGETHAQALVRECREELAVTIRVGELYMKVLHPYPDLTVELSLYHAWILEGEPQRLEHADFRWITSKQLREVDFCPADTEIIERLEREGAGPPADQT